MLSIIDTIKDNRILIFTWVKFDIESDYIDSKLGLFWLILEPLLQTLIYSFIFSLLLPRPPKGNVPFIVFYLSGITVWQFMNTNWMSSGLLMVRFSRLVSGIKLSAEAMVIIEMMKRFVEFTINFFLLILIAAIYGFYPSTTYFLIPLIFFFMVLMTLGGMFFLSSLGIFIRDIPNITSMILRLLFFLSGVIITPDMLPIKYQGILELNPILHLIEAIRDLVIYSTLPSRMSLLYMGSFSFLIFFFGYTYFKKRQGIFVDYQ